VEGSDPYGGCIGSQKSRAIASRIDRKGNSLRTAVEAGDAAEAVSVNTDKKLSGPAGRLVQCFIEEAEASPETISSALQLIAFFAQGCKSADDWETLCRGPYGEELFTQAWRLLISKQWSKQSWLMNNCSGIAEYQKTLDYWVSEQGQQEIKSLLQSDKKEAFGRGLLICMGLLWNHSRRKFEDGKIVESIPIDLIEPHLHHEDGAIWGVATWVWTNTRRRHKSPKQLSRAILDTLLVNWLEHGDSREGGLAAYAMSCQIGIDRDFWAPNLTKTQARIVRECFDAPEESKNYHDSYEKNACIFVAYHAKTVWTDKELVSRIESVDKLDRGVGERPEWDVIRKKLGVKIPAKKRATRK
jgi:hypothetical protein